jgi:hypothetical protein
MSEIKQKQWMVIESGLGWVVPSIEKKMAILLRPFKSHKCKSN